MMILPSNSKTAAASRVSMVLQGCLLAYGLVLTLLLFGCASRAKWKKESFALTAPSDQAGTAAHTNVLSLRRVTVSPSYDGKSLVYRTGENSYERDPYAEFLVPPNRMFEQCVRGYLRNGHVFAEVVDPGSSLKSSLSMEIAVTQLYGDFRHPKQPFAVLQLRFLLYNTEPPNAGRVIWQRQIFKRVPLAHRTPAALVDGWNAGLRQIMEEVNGELRSSITLLESAAK